MAVLQWPVFPMTLALADAKIPPRAMLVSWCVFVTAAIVVFGLLRSVAGKGATAIAAIAVSVYCTLCTALALYRIYTHEWLDLALLTAIPADSLATARAFISDAVLAGAAAMLLLHVAIYAFAATALSAAVAAERGARMKTLIGAVILLPCVAFAGAPHQDLLIDWMMARRTAGIRPVMDPAVYTIAPAESVFLVQLESLNALAVNREYEVDGKRVTTDGMPVMRRLASEGILFPHIWSADIQTHRVQQAFLCGALRSLSVDPFFEQVPYHGGCLPDLFRKAGYRTAFLKGDETFANADEIMPILGYDEVRFGELMQPGDESHIWGYEERIYFQRAMEHLERTYRPGQRLFVHFSASAHHASFSRTRDNDHHWFRAPHAQQVAEYIASARKQDAPLAELRERIDRLTGGNAHIFIFGDHSYPVGLYGSTQPHIGATIDNFVTPMLYLPPRARASEFALGRTVNTLHGQTDLAATLAELTSRKPHPNSLVPFMQRTPPAKFDYERCHVMTQPFGYRTVVIAHGDKTYAYSFARRCIETFQLTYDPLRQQSVGSECDVEFEEFERRYMCARFKR